MSTTALTGLVPQVSGFINSRGAFKVYEQAKTLLDGVAEAVSSKAWSREGMSHYAIRSMHTALQDTVTEMERDNRFLKNGGNDSLTTKKPAELTGAQSTSVKQCLSSCFSPTVEEDSGLAVLTFRRPTKRTIVLQESVRGGFDFCFEPRPGSDVTRHEIKGHIPENDPLVQGIRLKCNNPFSKVEEVKNPGSGPQYKLAS